MSARDRFDKSALFYASSVGDIQSVKVLKIKSPVNDGSLHEAARLFYNDIVRTLIKSKHSPDFPSRHHENRSAIQIMAVSCSGVDKLAEMEATIDALVEGKTDIMKPWNGRNALFLALDNPSPYPIARAIIDRAMWEKINDEKNVFEGQSPDGRDRTKYILSPTMYVKKEWSPVVRSDEEVDKLYSLLREKGCVDRYYAEHGAEQPPDAIGLPRAMDADIKKKRQKQLEHEIKLKREMQLAEQQEMIEQMKHTGALYRQEQMQRLQTSYQRQDAMQKLELARNASVQKMRTMQEEEAQRREVVVRLGRVELQKCITMDLQKQSATERELSTAEDTVVVPPVLSPEKLRLPREIKSSQCGLRVLWPKGHTDDDIDVE